MVFLSIVAFLDGLFLFLFSLNLAILLIMALRYRSICEFREKELTAYPFVTIQIPLFNERYVAERVIKAASRIRYPKDRFEIQILDDSTDDTLEITTRLEEELTHQGIRISLLHRTERTGYKGGALREGLAVCRGELVAVFDADFVPDPGFLEKVVPYFIEDPELGMVQTRWGHLNPDYSMLTRAQAILIDCHFSIDQVARGGSSLLMNFNGTAGIWRKQTILDAGNWQDDTVTEDLDLSYRAELAGWKMHYIRDITNEAELPVHLTAYKNQQFRWAKGSIQTAKKLLKSIGRSKLRVFQKYQAMLHLLYYAVHPLLLINIILSLPLILLNQQALESAGVLSGIASVFGIGVIFTLLFFIFSQSLAYPRWHSRLWWIPPAMIVGLGLAVNNSVAVIEGFVGKPSAFLRTPKLGIADVSRSSAKKAYYLTSSALIRILEFVMMLYCLAGIVITAGTGDYFIIPYYAIYASAFTYTFFLGYIQKIKLLKPAVTI